MPGRNAGTLIAVLLIPALYSTPVGGKDETTSGSRRLDPNELNAIFKKAQESQSLFLHLDATLSFRLLRDPDQSAADLKSSTTSAAFNERDVTGTMHWTRDGAKERLETRYDVPIEYMPRGFEDRLFVNESDKQIECLLRTKQVLFKEPGGFACLTPGHWFFAGCMPFEKLISSSWFTFEGFVEPTGTQLVIFKPKVEGRGRDSIHCRIDPALEHALIEWSRPQDGTRCVIEHARNMDGLIVPKSATLEVSGPTSQVRSRSVLNVKSMSTEVDHRKLQFVYQPGMLISDSRSIDGENKCFRVDQAGNLVEIPVNSGRPSRMPSFSTRAWAILMALSLLSVTLLIFLLRKPATPSGA